jgi:hypothetical protein
VIKEMIWKWRISGDVCFSWLFSDAVGIKTLSADMGTKCFIIALGYKRMR